MQTITFNTIADVVQAVPPLLGFYPTDSLVTVLLTESQPVVIRIDLHETDAIEPYWIPIERQRQALRITELLTVVIADDMDAHRGLVNGLSRRARAAGIRLPVAVWTAQITASGTWKSYLDSSEGRIPDPTTALLAAISVHEGIVIHPSREALANTLTPTAPAETLARRALLIKQQIAALGNAAATRIVVDATNAKDGMLPEGDEQIAALTAALHSPLARDAAITALDVTNLDPAIALWHHILRNVPPPHQGHAVRQPTLRGEANHRWRTLVAARLWVLSWVEVARFGAASPAGMPEGSGSSLGRSAVRRR